MIVRVVTAVAVLVSAVVHLQLWLDGFRDIAVIGPSFLLNAGAGAVIALLLLTWRHWIPPLLAVGFGLATLGAFVLSTTVGLFGVHEVWSGRPVLTAAISEVVAALGGLVLLALEQRRRSGVEPEHRLAGRGADLH
jgi:hypothetical protein